MEPEETVLAFVAAWNALDYGRIYALMADDIVYHNVPMKPVTGIAKVKAGFDAWPVDSCEWILLNIAAHGNVVLTERLDRFVRGEALINVPVMGAFEVVDGKITHWRDYFDMASLKPVVEG